MDKEKLDIDENLQIFLLDPNYHLSVLIKYQSPTKAHLKYILD